MNVASGHAVSMVWPLLLIAGAFLGGVAGGAVIVMVVARIGDRARLRQSDITEANERRRRLLRRHR